MPYPVFAFSEKLEMLRNIEDAGNEKTITFGAAVSSPGNYTIDANGKTVSWTVSLPSSSYLNVPHVPQTDRICYLGCITTVGKYYDSGIRLSDVN